MANTISKQQKGECDMSADTKEVVFTPDMLDQFKAKYDESCDDNMSSFQFNGNCYLCGYAKYLIEYLEGYFGEQERAATPR